MTCSIMRVDEKSVKRGCCGLHLYHIIVKLHRRGVTSCIDWDITFMFLPEGAARPDYELHCGY